MVQARAEAETGGQHYPRAADAGIHLSFGPLIQIIAHFNNYVIIAWCLLTPWERMTVRELQISKNATRKLGARNKASTVSAAHQVGRWVQPGARGMMSIVLRCRTRQLSS